MRPARTPSTAPVARPAAPPLPRYGGGPASEASDCSAFRAMNRRTVLGALAGAGAATLLGAGSAAARQAGSEAGTRAGHGSGDTLLIKAFPDAEKERMRLARALRSSDFIPTGRYATAGEPVSVTVRPAGGRVPTLHIGTFDYYNTESALQEPRATPLRPGRNTVGDAHGGPIYLSFAGEGERLAAQRTLGQTSNLLTVDPKTGLNPYQSALPKLGTSGIGYEKTFGAYEKLIPLRQLELAFGEDFWPRLHRLVRSEHQHDAPVDDYTHDPAVNARQYLALASYAGRTAGYDLTDFFVHKWALPIDSAGVAALAALGLPKPSVDPSTLTD